MNNTLNIGSGLTFLLISLPIIGVIFWPHSPYIQDYELLYLSPNVEHWFGADDTGRDLVARICIGVGISFSVGVLSVIIGVLIGLPLGCYSAFYGGTVDLLHDYCEQEQAVVAQLSPDTVEAIRPFVPTDCHIQNPIDTGAPVGVAVTWGDREGIAADLHGGKEAAGESAVSL